MTAMKHFVLSILTVISFYSHLHGQINLDVLIGTSTFDRDRIIVSPELEKNNWSFFLSGGMGKTTQNSTSGWVLMNIVPDTNWTISNPYDSIYYSTMKNDIYTFYQIDIGSKYNFKVLNKNEFYFGLSAGLSFEKHMHTTTNKSLDLYNDPVVEFSAQYGSIPYNVLEETNKRGVSNSLAWRFALLTGIDIPLNESFKLNLEVSASFLDSKWSETNFWLFRVEPIVKGGLVYTFLKAKKGDQ